MSHVLGVTTAAYSVCKVAQGIAESALLIMNSPIHTEPHSMISII